MIGFTQFKRVLLASAFFAFAAHASAAELSLDIYNPGTQAIFPVSSVLVSGEKEAILVDAQFGKSQAEQVVEKIRASGKQLTTIYISHGDPDYYFGLDTLTAAFPNAKVLASQPTVDHIKQTVDGKLAFWGPKMGADVPAKTIVPDVLKGDSLMLEGQKLQVVGLEGKQPDRTFVWIPSIKTAFFAGWSAAADAAMMFVSLPIVDQVRAPSIESMITRVRAAVAAPPSRMRTL
jgi:glyoxylase-like metal-dependent hydrolase (beta-lactamase superfamily II)